VQKLDGDLVAGQRLTVVLGTGGSAMVFRPVVVTAVPAEKLCWLGSVGPHGLFDGQHCFVLTATADGTHLVQTETFSGLLVGPLTKGLIDRTAEKFAAMNAALKRRAG
jgi:hypothetical protein